MDVLEFIVNEIVSKPALLIGLMALIGLVAMMRAPSEILSGTLKTILGFIILIGGAGIVVGALTPLGTMIQVGFHLHGVVPTNEAIVALAQKAFGPQTAIIMALGFAANLVLARFTPAKYVFLTGHHLFFMATVLAVVLGASGVTGVHGVILGAIMLGTIATVMPALVQPFMRKVNGDAGFALGHFNSLGYIVASYVGKAVGKGSKTTEDIKVPDRLGFLRDNLVMTTLVMIIVYVGLVLLAGPKSVEAAAGGGNYVMYAFTEGLTFGAGVAVILLRGPLIIAGIVSPLPWIAPPVVPPAMPSPPRPPPL